MKALDPVKHAVQIDKFISKLRTIDPDRINYYDDLRKYLHSCRF